MSQFDAAQQKQRSSEEIYKQFAPIILVYLCQHVSTQQDAEDLLFEVLLAALKSEKFAIFTKTQQLAWLRQVARNKMVDYYRHTKQIKLLPLEWAKHIEDPALQPEHLAEQQESYTQIAQAIAQLSPSQQNLIYLRYGQGLRLVTIATILDKPQGTVRKWLARTLKQLRITLSTN